MSNAELTYSMEDNLNVQMGRPATFVFDGQQEGERILYTFVAHRVAFWSEFIWYLGWIALITAGLWYAADFIPNYSGDVQLAILVLGSAIGLVTAWWINKYYTDAKVFLTERRILRFEPKFPCFCRKRALFWANVIKTKAIPQNLIYRIFKIGNLTIAPISGEDEDIKLEYVYYYEDLANYIDKILFLSKHNPQELSSIKEFVLKPKGQRF